MLVDLDLIAVEPDGLETVMEAAEVYLMNAGHFENFVVSLFLPSFNFSCFPRDFYSGFPELPFLVLMETLSQTFDTESENTYIF